MSISIATIKEKYACCFTIEDKQPFASYRRTVEGNGAPGFLKGKALASLTEKEGTIIVTVSGDGQVGGLIARVAQRLQVRAPTMVLEKTFKCLQKHAASH